MKVEIMNILQKNDNKLQIEVTRFLKDSYKWRINYTE